MTAAALTLEQADTFARLALGHVAREYPNKLDHVLGGGEDAASPRPLHPLFYGSFDWHSCVHGYWMLTTLLRRFPDMPTAGAVRARFDAAFTAEAVAGELAYLDRPHARGFERPYGWAWALALATALRVEPRWAEAFAPLAAAFAERFRAFLPLADYPVRAGAHTNTAFALLLALGYAEGAEDDGLAALVRTKARAWYGSDRDCQAWEPSQDDFLSPALMEAVLMGEALRPSGDFAAWFAAFLPRLARGEPVTLLNPARVSDRSDGKIAHLDGLNLSRAWCWRMLAPRLPESERSVARAAAERHLAASLPHVSGDYMGEHWLATYAVLALGTPA